jgi:23S rRNA pseudouridine1911/1915/1917 synthase
MTETSAQRLLIDRGSAGTRLDLFLTEHFKPDRGSTRRFSRAEIQRLIGAGQITLNGAKTKASARVRSNDQIDIRLLPPRATTLNAEALPLEVIYEDADCIVINKAPGMTVHPAAGHWSGTLVNALLHHCFDIEGIGGERRPGIVHRLDKDTSGVMIVAKNTTAYNELVLQFKHRAVEKEYIALAWGRVMPDKGFIDRPIGRHRSDRKKMSSIRYSHRSRAAVTEWSVQGRFMLKSDVRAQGVVSLLKLSPRTGRTHQLRVHLADSGHPLVGDRVYGKHRNALKRSSTDLMVESFPRQALHASKLVLSHPRTGERMTFTAPLPQDLLDLLRHLQSAQSARDNAEGLTR